MYEGSSLSKLAFSFNADEGLDDEGVWVSEGFLSLKVVFSFNRNEKWMIVVGHCCQRLRFCLT